MSERSWDISDGTLEKARSHIGRTVIHTPWLSSENVLIFVVKRIQTEFILEITRAMARFSVFVVL